MGGWTDGRMDGWTDGRMADWMMEVVCRLRESSYKFFSVLQYLKLHLTYC
jgi:hypothetical protein